jgi:hypothetical protein
MKYNEVDMLFGDIPWNYSFYGCATNDGKVVWSNDIHGIISLPNRIRYTGIYEAPFGKVRECLLDMKNHYALKGKE